MTTTPAMPELPEPFALSVSVHEGDTPAKTYVECMLYQKHPNEKQRLYTADQMRAYALATLQAQPAAEVSDAEIKRVWYACGVGTDYDVPPSEDDMRFARAVLALRPQAVPMSRKELGEATARAHIAFCLAKFDTYEEALLTEFQAHHGITAPAGGEG